MIKQDIAYEWLHAVRRFYVACITSWGVTIHACITIYTQTCIEENFIACMYTTVVDVILPYLYCSLCTFHMPID